MVGEAGSGKTSLMKRKINNLYSVNPKVTLGVDFFKFPNEEFEAQLWDIAGQEINGNMLNLYSQQTNMFILVADLTKLNALESVEKWLEKLESLHAVPAGSSPILVATKSDAETRIVEIESLVAFAEKHQLIFDSITHVTSAKTGDQVAAFFENVLAIAKKMLPEPPAVQNAAFFKPVAFEIEDNAERRPLIEKEQTKCRCTIL
jgi:small GTP-binding protein